MNRNEPPSLARFNYITSEMNAAYHEATVKLGLSDSAMIVLYTVCICGDGCPIGDILHHSGISKQTVNSSLRKLERNGILTLAAVDGKQKKVMLTEHGKSLAESTAMRVIRIENAIFDFWSEEEQKTFLELNQRYLTALQKQIKEL